jgi:L-asparaginase
MPASDSAADADVTRNRNSMDTRTVADTSDQAMDVAIISTGGTFGMQTSARGLTPSPVADRIDAFLRSSPIPGLRYTISELTPQIDSANATPAAWQQIVEAIDECYDQFDGFVIVHGTDTMAYSTAAVCYAFAHRDKPIVFTGAQRPLSAPNSDGPANLVGALEHLNVALPGSVDIYFGGSVLSGTRAIKYSTIADRAFLEPARLRGAGAPDPKSRADAPPFIEYADIEIPVIRMYPGISSRVVSAMLDGEVPGAVLQCYGFGNVPAATPGLLDALSRASARGQVIVAVSQCFEGEITLGTSEVSTSLADAGVIDGADMTTEAAVTKLHYLFGTGISSTSVRELAGINLVGELARSR